MLAGPEPGAVLTTFEDEEVKNPTEPWIQLGCESSGHSLQQRPDISRETQMQYVYSRALSL